MITAKEAKKVSDTHFYDPFCISMEHVYRVIEDEAYRGTSDCSFTVPEEHLYTIKKELRDQGFDVYSEELKPQDDTCENNIFSRYPSYKELYHLEVSWH